MSCLTAAATVASFINNSHNAPDGIVTFLFGAISFFACSTKNNISQQHLQIFCLAVSSALNFFSDPVKMLILTIQLENCADLAMIATMEITEEKADIFS